MIYNIINRMTLKFGFRYKIIKAVLELSEIFNVDFLKYKV